MVNKSIVEVACEVLKEKEGTKKFQDLFNEVSKRLEMTDEEKDENISRFYTKLTIDERFVLLEDNTWDLRERQSFDKIHIDMNEIYSEIEDEEKELEAEKAEDSIYDDEPEPSVDDEDAIKERVDDEEE